MTTRRILWTLVAIVAIAVIARSVYWMATPGFRVFITNDGARCFDGSDALRDVTIYVAGATYDLGDLLLAETKQVHICSAAETFMVIEYTDKGETNSHTRDIPSIKPSRGTSHHLKGRRIR
jgi:hypothetical protein